MYLNPDILYYHLSAGHHVEYIRAKHPAAELKRPLYFSPAVQENDHLIFFKDLDCLPEEGTYLCFQMPLLPPKASEISILLIKDDADPDIVYNEVQSIFDLYDEWEDDCQRSLVRNQSFQHLLQVTYHHFPYPVCLTDDQFSVVATVHEENCSFSMFEDDTILSAEIVNHLISNPHIRGLEMLEGVIDFDYDENYKLYNFITSGTYRGRLIMGIRNDRDHAVAELILSHLADFVEVLLARFGSFQISSGSVQSQLHTFLTEQLSGIAASADKMNRLTSITGWSETAPYMMIYFLPEHRLKRELYPPYLVSMIENHWPGVCAVEHHNNVAALINMELYGFQDKEDFFQSLAYLVRDGLMIAGCSRIFNSLSDASLFFRQAEYAIEFGKKKSPTRWYFLFDDYCLDYMLYYGIGVFKPEQICHPALIQLRKHDQEKQTSYYETIEMYFREQFNMSVAAQKLFIHRSTFINRIERIEELTRINLADNNTRLYLALSMRLLRDSAKDVTFQFYV